MCTFLSKLITERQTANMDNMGESQFNAVENNRDDMNNLFHETPFLFFNHQIFLSTHTQTSLA
jgi:hypothetical protein